MKVVVVGGGIAGMAAAARLAKLGHQVSLVEASDQLGGALNPITADGFSWDPVHAVTLPGVLRDLFRKSGRPMEREIDFEPLPVIREHVFAATKRGQPANSAVIRSGRSAQSAAFSSLDAGLGKRWIGWVDSFAAEWETLRRHLFEVWDPSPDLDQVLATRTSLARRARELKDSRLVAAATHTWSLAGHDARRVPGWGGLLPYLEMTFGSWQISGGMGALVPVMTKRLATRKVEVITGTRVTNVAVESGAVAGIRTQAGTMDADVVVVACDPRRLFALAPVAARQTPAFGPRMTLLGLDETAPVLDREVVIHADPMIVVRPGATNPRAWTVLSRGRTRHDVITALAQHHWQSPSGPVRLDVRDAITTRVELSAADQVGRWLGSPLGVAWTNRRNDRLGPLTGIKGLYAGGAWASPGVDFSFAALTATPIASLIGPV